MRPAARFVCRVVLLVAGFGLVGIPDALAQQTDTLRTLRRDTTAIPRVADVIRAAKEPSVRFKARDSLRFQFRGGRTGRLFGAAQVEHKEGTLESGIIGLDLDKQEMEATATVPGDTLTQPVLRRESQEVRSQSIRFNYQTGRGRYEVAKVSIEQGNITGGQVKNVTPHVVFIQDAIYSTCPLDHPHFYIGASQMKVVDQEEVFFTRARLYFLDIPYPIVFPFGYFPGGLSKKKSGLLPVVYSYQEQQQRGLGLQNLGWFQHFGDYLTGSAAVDIFTSGTFFARSQVQYAKTNNLRGSINLGYSVDQGMESTDPDFSRRRQNRLNVQHNQRFSPYANITADVTLQTSEYLRRNSLNIDDRAEVSTNSYISYRYNHPEQKFTFNADLRQSQNFLTNTTDVTGPSASFSLRTISPFRRSGTTGRGPWYESLTVNYNNRFQSAYRYRPLAADTATVNWFEALLDPSLYRQATGDDRHVDYGFRQDANANVQLLGGEAVQLTANLAASQVLVPYTVRRFVNPDSNTTRNVSSRDFSAFHDGSASLNLSGRVYGIWNQRIGNLTSFRHTLSPTVGFSLRPDFGSDFWGYYIRPIDERTGQPYVPVDTLTGAVIDNRYSRFERNVFNASPSRGMARLLNLSVGNVFEAKQVRRDTTGERTEQVLRLVDNLNFSTSYNFAADEFRLSPLQATFSSSLIQRMGINANATFDFYGTNAEGQRVNRLLWDSDRKPLRLTTFSINGSSRFSKGQMGGFQAVGTPYFPRFYDPFDQTIFSPFDPLFNRMPVEPLYVPWAVTMNFSYSWSRGINNRINRNAILQASSIQVKLTRNWDLGTRLGYDFIQKRLTPAEFSLARNLHCWDLNFQWNPFGDFKYYYFTLKVNNAQFQGIFQKLPGLNLLDQGSSRVRNARNNSYYY